MQSLLENFKDYLIVDKGFSKNTAKSYSNALKQFINYLKTEKHITKIEKITENSVRHYLRFLHQNRKNKDSTRSHRLSAIKTFFNFLKTEQIIKNDYDILKNVNNPKIAHRLPEFIQKHDTKKILEKITRSLEKALIETLYSTMCRAEELCSMNLKDITFEYDEGVPIEGTIIVREGKGKKDRAVFISKRCAPWLYNYVYAKRGSVDDLIKVKKIELTRAELIDRLNSEKQFISNDSLSALFISSRGKRIAYRTVYGICKRNGFNPHKMRHTGATHLSMNGINIVDLQHLLGHQKASTTSIYQHTTLEHMKEQFKKTSDSLTN